MCSTYGETRNAYRTIIRKPPSKRPLRIRVRSGATNIKLYLGEIDCGMTTGKNCSGSCPVANLI
jgi:hypothetical protein